MSDIPADENTEVETRFSRMSAARKAILLLIIAGTCAAIIAVIIILVTDSKQNGSLELGAWTTWASPRLLAFLP
jgi:hypothetical protein